MRMSSNQRASISYDPICQGGGAGGGDGGGDGGGNGGGGVAGGAFMIKYSLYFRMRLREAKASNEGRSGRGWK